MGQKKLQSDLLRRTLIIGLGETGLSCARFLVARGVSIAVTDSRPHPPALDRMREELPDVALFVGGFDESAFAAAQQMVISPGISLKEPLVARASARGVPVVGDIELFAQYVDAPVIAITGSNGKSTVTTLVGEMARNAGFDARVGGNLGTPALDLLAQARAAHASGPTLYVLELSSFQLETTVTLNPVAAVVLNVSPDHMDRYTDVTEYAQAKRRVYRGAGVMVINVDDARVAAMAGKKRRSVRFGLGLPQDAESYGVKQHNKTAVLVKGKQELLRVDEMRLQGSHNWANALAALALGEAAGLPLDAMLHTLRIFTGLPHRMQWVGASRDITWYDDSKGTNVGATLAALSGAPGPVVLIAGGDGKGQDFTPLRAGVAQKVRAVVLIGRDAGLIEAALNNVVPVVHAGDMDDAVERAAQLAQAGDCVLLSPACASFDMFSGYAQRGAVFAAAVQRWLQ